MFRSEVSSSAEAPFHCRSRCPRANIPACAATTLLTPVLPVPAQKHGISELVVNGETVDVTSLQGASEPRT